MNLQSLSDDDLRRLVDLHASLAGSSGTAQTGQVLPTTRAELERICTAMGVDPSEAAGPLVLAEHARRWDAQYRLVQGGREPHQVASLHVAHAAAAPELGGRGIIAAALALRTPADVPLILLWDEEGNTGMTLTNCMQPILCWVAAFWPLYPVREARVLQRDSDGEFDEVLPHWSGFDPPLATSFAWKAVRHDQARPRTWHAVEAVFGPLRSADMLDALSQVSPTAASALGGTAVVDGADRQAR